jgi:hypothetical protein
LATLALLGACAPAGERDAQTAAPATAAEDTTMSFEIRSPAFAPSGEIPGKHTCDSSDVSPPLEWSGAPAGTRSFALVVDDPDAPDPKAPQVVWVHWVLYNLPDSTTGLAEGVAARDLPGGTRQGRNDWKAVGYRGPCPPVGRHRYFHKLYALDTVLPDLGEPTKAKLEAAMRGHVLAEAELIGTYARR